MILFRNSAACEEQLEELRRRIRELEFTISQNPAKLDVDRQCLVINGLSYSLALFEGLAGFPSSSFLPIGTCFELVDRAGGAIMLRTIGTEIDARRVLKSVMEREARLAAQFSKLPLGDLHE